MAKAAKNRSDVSVSSRMCHLLFEEAVSRKCACAYAAHSGSVPPRSTVTSSRFWSHEVNVSFVNWTDGVSPQGLRPRHSRGGESPIDARRPDRLPPPILLPVAG